MISAHHGPAFTTVRGEQAMTGGFRVGGVAAVLTLASLFGAYSFFLESLNDAGGLEDGGNLSEAINS